MLSTHDMTALVEAALSGDTDRVCLIARHSMSSFDFAMLEKRVQFIEDDEPVIDYNLLASAEAGGYCAGYGQAVTNLRDRGYDDEADLLEKMSQPEAVAS